MINHPHNETPILIVISGPSGVGKDAVLNRMKELGYGFHFTVTATTRRRREGEIDGKDYLFLTTDEFTEKLHKDEFLESARVYNNFYGVPKEQVRNSLASGKDVVIKIDVQGAKTIKQQEPDGLFIFLIPPSMASLENRLRLRMTESKEALTLRLATAESEMKESKWFDLVIENPDNDLDYAVAEIIEAVKKTKSTR